MKYAFFILAFALFYTSMALAQDHKISSFQDSQALMTIAQFMSENGEDFSVSFRLSDNRFKVPSSETCTDVDPRAVVTHVEKALMSLLRMFPDEELPIDEAMTDLSSYLGSSPLKKCMVIKNGEQKQVNSAYYFDAIDRVHVKIDTITLKEL